MTRRRNSWCAATLVALAATSGVTNAQQIVQLDTARDPQGAQRKEFLEGQQNPFKFNFAQQVRLRMPPDTLCPAMVESGA